MAYTVIRLSLFLAHFLAGNQLNELKCHMHGCCCCTKNPVKNIVIFTHKQWLLSIDIKTKVARHVPRISTTYLNIGIVWQLECWTVGKMLMSKKNIVSYQSSFWGNARKRSETVGNARKQLKNRLKRLETVWNILKCLETVANSRICSENYENIQTFRHWNSWFPAFVWCSDRQIKPR